MLNQFALESKKLAAEMDESEILSVDRNMPPLPLDLRSNQKQVMKQQKKNVFALTDEVKDKILAEQDAVFKIYILKYCCYFPGKVYYLIINKRYIICHSDAEVS